MSSLAALWVLTHPLGQLSFHPVCPLALRSGLLLEWVSLWVKEIPRGLGPTNTPKAWYFLKGHLTHTLPQTVIATK